MKPRTFAIEADEDVTIETPCGKVHLYVREHELTVDTRPNEDCRVTYVEGADEYDQYEPYCNNMIYGVIRRRGHDDD